VSVSSVHARITAAAAAAAGDCEVAAEVVGAVNAAVDVPSASVEWH
jgi:hypothetical protein